MAGILGNTKSNAQREVEARRKAAEEARADAEFGRNFLNRVGGIGRGLDTYAEGGLKDLIGNVSGFFGNEDFASRMGLESDELYRRGGEFFDQGLAGGNTYLNEKSIPLTREEEIIRQQQLDAAKSTLSEGEAEFLKNAGLLGQVDAGGNLSLQSGKPNISFTRKEGESKEDFKNRIIKEQSVTAGAPASSYDVVPSELTGQSAYELQATIDALTASGGKGRGSINEQQGERAAFTKEQARKNDPMGDYSGEEPTVDLFMQAMADGNVAEGKEQPKAESREDMLEKYKQEFADATGIDISGKPDNSQALMAMGLSMLKNRAGKDFNVGKMLNAVGEAGEKAMPYVAKAASEAKAASAAAGKYALGRIQAGEASAAAFAKEVRAHNNAWNLEVMKQRSAIEQSGGKAGKLENKEKFKIGAGDITIATGTFKDDEYGERPVFVNGAADAGKITDAYKKYTEGQEYVVNMQDSLTALANRPEGPLPAKLIDSIKTFSVKLGLADPKAAFGEEGVSEAEQFQVYRQATINAFKKLILQESQVSNLDLTTLFASFGEDGFMASPEKAKLAIDTMMDYFSAKKRSLQAPLSNMTERDWFQTETDYNRTQKLLSGIGISSSSPVATTDGSRYTLDLTAIPKLNETG